MYQYRIIYLSFQTFDKDDYRLARFIDKSKQVNPNWAIKLIDDTPPEVQKDRIVACDGGGGPLGHPKVYINLVSRCFFLLT